MTEKQFKEYTIIKKEVDEIKSFLDWYGKTCTKIIGKKKKISIATGYYTEIELPLPTELQNTIIDVIEQYVKQREKDMEAI